jgi:hypothetical protein
MAEITHQLVAGERGSRGASFYFNPIEVIEVVENFAALH